MMLNAQNSAAQLKTQAIEAYLGQLGGFTVPSESLGSSSCSTIFGG